MPLFLLLLPLIIISEVNGIPCDVVRQNSEGLRMNYNYTRKTLDIGYTFNTFLSDKSGNEWSIVLNYTDGVFAIDTIDDKSTQHNPNIINRFGDYSHIFEGSALWNGDVNCF